MRCVCVEEWDEKKKTRGGQAEGPFISFAGVGGALYLVCGGCLVLSPSRRVCSFRTMEVVNSRAYSERPPNDGDPSTAQYLIELEVYPYSSLAENTINFR